MTRPQSLPSFLRPLLGISVAAGKRLGLQAGAQSFRSNPTGPLVLTYDLRVSCFNTQRAHSRMLPLVLTTQHLLPWLYLFRFQYAELCFALLSIFVICHMSLFIFVIRRSHVRLLLQTPVPPSLRGFSPAPASDFLNCWGCDALTDFSTDAMCHGSSCGWAKPDVSDASLP